MTPLFDLSPPYLEGDYLATFMSYGMSSLAIVFAINTWINLNLVRISKGGVGYVYFGSAGKMFWGVFFNFVHMGWLYFALFIAYSISQRMGTGPTSPLIVMMTVAPPITCFTANARLKYPNGKQWIAEPYAQRAIHGLGLFGCICAGWFVIDLITVIFF